MTNTNNEFNTYKDVFEYDINLMNVILGKHGETEEGWNNFYSLYKDPDGYPIEIGNYNVINGVKCTFDALLSAKRIKDHEGFNSNFVESYKLYRETPIFYFPSERGGINTSRYSKFGDKIDYFLFDLKRKCEGQKDCKLESTYNLPKTKKWLEYFEYNFNKIVEFYKLENAFVKKEGQEYKILNLETNDGSYVESYQEYNWSWSNNYYNNVKKQIDIWKDKK